MAKVTDIAGLSESEAAARRARGQGNNVSIPTSRSYWQIVQENLLTFINLVLFSIGLLLVALGRPSDALVSVGIVLMNTLVGVVQEVRAKRKLDQIALLTRPQARVIREGQERSIDPSQIVVGDILLVRPGDQIVVGGQVIDSSQMDVDESLLSGESNPVPKQAGDQVYAGSFCVTGEGLYEAQKVGTDSLAHQITAGARAFRRIKTPLQQYTDQVVRILLVLSAYFGIMLVIGAVLSDQPLVETMRDSAVIAGLIPNGLFIMISVAYAAGAVRIARQGALVQQANGIESLSHVNVLCLDKTGTLTANRLRLQALYPIGLSDAELRQKLGDYVGSTSGGNLTSRAIGEACPGLPQPAMEEVPFYSVRKWSALALAEGSLRGVYVLGAPEMLLPHAPLDATAQAQVDAWTAGGLRVLLFAHSPEVVPLRDAQDQPQLPAGMVPLGLISLSDELRPQAQETLRGFALAGIQLKIISGDSPRTVEALARQAGLTTGGQVISGPELAALPDSEWPRVAEQTSIFGRISPQQKERLVATLLEGGHYVAMIGDGVNDVLSLKRAQLGIAIESGSQIARGVADIVLLGDSFAALPQAFLEGQRIRNGMQDIFKLFLTRIAYMTLLIVSIAVIGAGFPFSPKHNGLLTFLTVGAPTLGLVAWARPGPARHRDMARGLMHFVLPAALMLTLVGLGVYMAYFLASTFRLQPTLPNEGTVEALDLAFGAAFASSEALARSAVITITVFCGLLLVPFVEPPTAFWVGGDELSGDWRPTLLAGLMLIVYIVILSVPGLRGFFELVPLRRLDYILLGALALLWGLALRYLWRARLLERFLNIDLG